MFENLKKKFAKQSIVCVYQDKRREFEIPEKAKDLKKKISKAYQLHQDEILGLSSGGIIYPLSYLTRFGSLNKDLVQENIFKVCTPGEEGSVSVGTMKNIYSKGRNQNNEKIYALTATDILQLKHIKDALFLADVTLEAFYIFFVDYVTDAAKRNDEGSLNCECISKENYIELLYDLMPAEVPLMSINKSESIIAKLCSFYSAIAYGNVFEHPDHRMLFIGLSCFLNVPEKHLFEFAFALYDRKETGIISKNDASSILRAIILVGYSSSTSLSRLCDSGLKSQSVADIKKIMNYVEEMVAGVESLCSQNNEMSFRLNQFLPICLRSNCLDWLYILCSLPPTSWCGDNSSTHSYKLIQATVSSIASASSEKLADGIPPLKFTSKMDKKYTLEDPRELSVFLLEFPNGQRLQITSEDVKTVDLLVTATRMGTIIPEQLIAAFDDVVGTEKVLSLEKFHILIKRLVPGTNLNIDQQEYFSYLLQHMYEIYAILGEGNVNPLGILSALMFFVSGNKSHKLSLLYKKFVGEKMKLSMNKVSQFLESLLTLLLCLKETLDMFEIELWVKNIRTTCSEITENIIAQVNVAKFNETDTLSDMSSASASNIKETFVTELSFEQFGCWYNEHGGDYIHWIELLDLQKWPLDLYSKLLSLESAEELSTIALDPKTIAALEFQGSREQNVSESSEHIIPDLGTPESKASVPDVSDKSKEMQDGCKISLAQTFCILPPELKRLRDIISSLSSNGIKLEELYRNFLVYADSDFLITTTQASSLLREIFSRVPIGGFTCDEKEVVPASIESPIEVENVDPNSNSGKALKDLRKDLENNCDYAINLGRPETGASFSREVFFEKFLSILSTFLLLTSKSGHMDSRKVAIGCSILVQSSAEESLSMAYATFAKQDGEQTLDQGVCRKWCIDQLSALDILHCLLVGLISIKGSLVDCNFKKCFPDQVLALKEARSLLKSRIEGGVKLRFFELVQVVKTVPVLFSWMGDVCESEKENFSLNGEQGLEHLQLSQDVFRFEFPADNFVLCFDHRSLSYFSKIVELCGFQKLKIEELVATLQKGCREERMEFEEFHELVGDLLFDQAMNSLQLNPSVVTDLFSFFENVYDVLATSSVDSPRVEMKSIIIFLSFLCQGSKSDKLEFTFGNYCEGDQMDRTQIRSFLEVHLNVLHAITARNQRSSTTKIQKIGAVAEYLAQVIFEETDTHRRLGNAITFSELARFYSLGGYVLLSWLELLDATKWTTEKKSGSTRPVGSRSVNVGNQSIVFCFELQDQAASLIVRQNDINLVERLLSKTMLFTISPHCFFNTLRKFIADKSHGDTPAAFVELLRGTTELEAQETIDSDALKTLFQDSLENLNKYGSKSDLKSHFLPFVLLCHGTKSEKLQQAFDFFYENMREKKEEVREHISLLPEELSEFLLLFCKFLFRTAGKEIPFEKVLSNYIDKLIGNIELDVDESRISFLSFANWYSNAGFKNAAWLELLDLKKWNFSCSFNTLLAPYE
eukprot:snap_masked-scaffold_1-processed-gene-18.13-mRNA-1 protein AED:1.00 eAED:1.00 QI:0/0/0/0/1/1/4/0/1499